MVYKTAAVLLLFCWCAGAAAQQQTGKIVFYREPHFLTSDYKPKIFCNGAELARMENGAYLEATAQAGRYVCVAESTDGPPTTVDVIPGANSYLRIAITDTVKRHAFLVLTTEEEFQRQSQLKLLPAVLLGPAQPVGRPAQAVQKEPPTGEARGHSGSFGRLSVTATNVYTVVMAGNADKSVITILVSLRNSGDTPLCASFAPKLKTSFGFEYIGGPVGMTLREVPADSTAQRGYSFEVKSGVKPLELNMELDGGTIRCADNSDIASVDATVPNEIWLDVHDLPGFPAEGSSGQKAVLPDVDGVGHPSCVYCPDPRYSSKARGARLEGTVVLKAIITADGAATNVEVVRSIGNGMDEEAVAAVRTWRFTPARGPDGQPVATIVPLEITFRLVK